MQIVSMDQELISSLNAEFPSGLSDLAALAGCDEISAVAAKAGVALMIKGAQQQMAAAGQSASAEQIQGMMKNGMDQQLATLQASLAQQSDMVNALLVAYDAIGGPPPNEALFAKQLSESTDAVKDAHKALTMAAAAPEEGTNSMEKWANNGNFLCYWGMYRMALESIVIPLHTHYKQADPSIAAFLTDQCANLASVEEAAATSAVAKLKEIASTLPSAATQKVALEIPDLLKQGAAAVQKTHSATNEPLARFLGEHLSDPTFALILDTLHNAGAQGHGLALQNMATAASQDPSGELGAIAADLATAAGKRDFISLKLSDGHKQAAQQMIQQQGQLAQLTEQNKAVQQGTAAFVEMIVKDIVPFYHHVKDQGIKPTGKNDPFASLYEGVFSATGVVNQEKQAIFEQFLIFRKTVRGDATILPRVTRTAHFGFSSLCCCIFLLECNSPFFFFPFLISTLQIGSRRLQVPSPNEAHGGSHEEAHLGIHFGPLAPRGREPPLQQKLRGEDDDLARGRSGECEERVKPVQICCRRDHVSAGQKGNSRQPKCQHRRRAAAAAHGLGTTGGRADHWSVRQRAASDAFHPARDGSPRLLPSAPRRCRPSAAPSRRQKHVRKRRGARFFETVVVWSREWGRRAGGSHAHGVIGGEQQQRGGRRWRWRRRR